MLHALRWHRVLVDEANLLANPRTARARAAHLLRARSRWAIAGASVLRKSQDLCSMLRFLGAPAGASEPPLGPLRVFALASSSRQTGDPSRAQRGKTSKAGTG